ncbi:Phosphoribosylglycinamide formyltransferase 2 [Aquicella siphonis]|uniref:Formate-dependent phosphoribosylglycinamide formyltransferase n=1 Tax=Aquicella siphonis TaxID=254247 RepID=A0A5E4PH57_9COXI|nr:formate-dependent phosphoribosylglycinamide formyltransferase [Aquicella siphonis]VVC75651.1 Phosphoribosylglycinamide formyltransferase 2 [Aquicella siphonis]
MVVLGTPNTATATRMLLLGAGELGKEVAIEAQRLGVEVTAVDRYAGAPAMQVAHRSHVISMLDGDALRTVIEAEKPDFIVPEIEAVATDTLIDLEGKGYCVVPTAKAARLTMNREGIRRLAAEQLHLMTSPYAFASSLNEYHEAVKTVGIPCVVKPIMSSSGKGQSIIRSENEVDKAWEIARTAGRTQSGQVIVEAFIPFDYEITLLTVRHVGGTTFCAPIGHAQINGDYRESWQPHPMPEALLRTAQQMARAVTDSLGGYGLFGVEFFIKGDQVYFSEVSPRPHDTGLVTLVSQDQSEFALHVRAILGLPVPSLRQLGCAASHALLARGHGSQIRYHHLDLALDLPETQLRLFGKPEVQGERRVGVVLAIGDSVETARARARQAHDLIRVEVRA